MISLCTDEDIVTAWNNPTQSDQSWQATVQMAWQISSYLTFQLSMRYEHVYKINPKITSFFNYVVWVHLRLVYLNFFLLKLLVYEYSGTSVIQTRVVHKSGNISETVYK